MKKVTANAVCGHILDTHRYLFEKHFLVDAHRRGYVFYTTDKSEVNACISKYLTEKNELQKLIDISRTVFDDNQKCIDGIKKAEDQISKIAKCLQWYRDDDMTQISKLLETQQIKKTLSGVSPNKKLAKLSETQCQFCDFIIHYALQ